MKKATSSRRSFLKQSSMTAGLAAFGSIGLNNGSLIQEKLRKDRLPREVWIAGISQMDLQTETAEMMVDEVIQIMNSVFPFQPDIICLPEVFPTSNINRELSLSDKVAISEKILLQFSALAKQHNCYIICPLITSEGGKVYNAAVVFDRSGSRIGEYRKMHLTIDEIESGLTMGPLDPPIFRADFGKFGIQICYDIYWNDGWEKLCSKGAEIIFWPSAFAAGQRVNIKACENQCIVVTSTRKNTSKICDIRGEVVAETGFWQRNSFVGTVNLEKVLVDTWPHVKRFNEITGKYGRKVRITTFHEEQWSVIESLSPDLHISDILLEFGIKTYKQDIQEAESVQLKARNT
jgi:predicted amidohydrolase